MQPADPADLTAALATVRELTADPQRAMTDDEWRSLNIASRLLARELARLIDAGEAVRVRPLRWVHDRFEHDAWCSCVFGTMAVTLMPECWAWSYCCNGATCRGENPCDSLEDGKAKAEQWYRSRLAAALEPLFAKDKP